MTKLGVLFVFVIPFSLLAQEGNWWGEEASQKEDTLTILAPGKVQIHKDPKLAKLVEFKGATIPPAFGPQMNGFRVQLFFDQNKDAINDARAKFLSNNKNIDTYIEYKAPNYNLHVGNFRTELEAEKLRAKLSNDFPEGIVVKARIYPPKLEE